ncbi:MAG TPA: hypothetical protein VE869_06880 [Gemmatimonas sp.]|nr:hypothetical protein [Gemmatimonas sp.]
MRSLSRAVQLSSTHSRVQRALLAAALALGALLFVPSDAHAQLGKLKKLGGDLVKEAGRGAVGMPPKPADVADGAPKAKVDYTVTPERLDAVIVALAPLVEEARRDAAAGAVEKSFRAKRTAWEKCVELAGKNATGLSEAYLNASEKETGKSAEAMGRLAKAMQGGDKRKVAYLQDTVGVYTMEMTAMMVGAKCGPAMYTPSALIEAQLARDAGAGGEVDESGRVRRDLNVPEAARKGLTAQQFGVLRERVAIYAIELAKGDGSESSLASFTAAEHAALKSRANELKTMAPFFRDGHMRWATWGDVKGW